MKLIIALIAMLALACWGDNSKGTNALLSLLDIKDIFLVPDVVILYDSSISNAMIAVLDVKNVQHAVTRDSSTVMVNLTARLLITRSVTIKMAYDKKSVRVSVESGVMDSIPLFPNIQGYEYNGLSSNVTWSADCPLSNTIRINGETMTMGDAAARYPVIP